MKRLIFVLALAVILILPSFAHAKGNSNKLKNQAGKAFIYGYENGQIFSEMSYTTDQLAMFYLKVCAKRFSKPYLIKNCMEGIKTKLNIVVGYMYINH